jgi:DNA polymerase zeta
MGGPQTLGVMNDYEIPMDQLKALKDHITISPNGVVFVKSHVRQGVLGRMLTEILETRVMIKKSMKSYKNKKVCNINICFLISQNRLPCDRAYCE